jgi:hypothetical protein
MRWRVLARLALAAGAALVAPSAGRAQVTFGQTDTFQGGTQGWSQGLQAPGANLTVQPGGPGGAGDNFLQVISTGGIGAGSRMVIFNQTQWLGNYTAAGVSAIEMDLQNFTAAALTIRIGFRTGSAGSTTPGYVSDPGFTLPADGTWHHAVFPLTPATLTAVGSPPSLATVLAGPGELRILSSVGPNLIGDAINARIGIDNIRATPEPAHILALALAAAGVARPLARRWRARRPG